MDKGVDSLAELPQLAVLDLTGDVISNESLERLSGSPTLFNLNVSLTSVTDTGFTALVKCPKLTILDARLTNLSREALLELAKSDSLREIRVFSQNLNEADVAAAQEINNKLKVVMK